MPAQDGAPLWWQLGLYVWALPTAAGAAPASSTRDRRAARIVRGRGRRAGEGRRARREGSPGGEGEGDNKG